MQRRECGIGRAVAARSARVPSSRGEGRCSLIKSSEGERRFEVTASCGASSARESEARRRVRASEVKLQKSFGGSLIQRSACRRFARKSRTVAMSGDVGLASGNRGQCESIIRGAASEGAPSKGSSRKPARDRARDLLRPAHARGCHWATEDILDRSIRFIFTEERRKRSRPPESNATREITLQVATGGDRGVRGLAQSGACGRNTPHDNLRGLTEADWAS